MHAALFKRREPDIGNAFSGSIAYLLRQPASSVPLGSVGSASMIKARSSSPSFSRSDSTPNVCTRSTKERSLVRMSSIHLSSTRRCSGNYSGNPLTGDTRDSFPIPVEIIIAGRSTWRLTPTVTSKTMINILPETPSSNTLRRWGVQTGKG